MNNQVTPFPDIAAPPDLFLIEMLKGKMSVNSFDLLELLAVRLKIAEIREVAGRLGLTQLLKSIEEQGERDS